MPMFGQTKDRTLTVLLAFAGILVPGLHKLYLGQRTWGVAYLLPGLVFWQDPTGLIPRIASLMEGVWYLLQNSEEFNRRFNPGLVEPMAQCLNQVDPQQVVAIAESLRQLESLRQDGLITDYEFEQQRQQLLGTGG
jgi:TM2 domain-containing membrane protein YozV